jgi:hypothetical protein
MRYTYKSESLFVCTTVEQLVGVFSSISNLQTSNEHARIYGIKREPV